MRITPIPVWGHLLSDDDLEKAVILESSLTHSNPVALEACIIYCLTIKYLINNPDDALGAYCYAENLAQ